MKICITGGSGFIGSRLSLALVKKKHDVVIIDLTKPKKNVKGVSFIKADLLNGEIPEALSDCDAIIHLAGVNIFHRWTNDYKKLILDSRVVSAKRIFNFLSTQERRPRVFVSASAVGYYGNRGDELLNEGAGTGDDFLAHVCVEWEKAAREFEKLGMRTVSIRTATVLGPGGGMLSKVVPLFRWFLGGRLGSGRQWFSWIHIDDLVRVYINAALDKQFSGPINAVSPGILRNLDFTKALGQALHRKAFIPIPSFALKLALGEFSDVALGSQRVIPKKLNDLGFLLQYKDIYSALISILTLSKPIKSD